MKYLPLVWAAFRRHTTESLLTFLVLTVAFALFSSMVALKAAYEQAINVNRMDRLVIFNRFCCTDQSISRRDELMRIPGVRGTALLQAVFGFHQDRSMRVGVWAIDAGTISAIPELGLTAAHWKQLHETPNGVLFTRAQAAKWNVKAGDTFIVQTRSSRRADGSTSWPFTVLDVVNDPVTQIDWMPNIYGNYEYVDAALEPGERGRQNFVLAIDDPDDGEAICRKIDTTYESSEVPTYCVPMQMDARNMIEANISMRQMSLGIGTAGLFMILFLCANGVAESVRERIPEFAVLKTIGFGDRQIAALVFLEAALPAIGGAVLGTTLAGALGSFASRLGDGSGLNLPAASVSPWIVALALGAALLIGAVSAVLPLRRLRTLELAPALAGR
jgi:putative ABC transport system permease protein